MVWTCGLALGKPHLERMCWEHLRELGDSVRAVPRLRLVARRRCLDAARVACDHSAPGDRTAVFDAAPCGGGHRLGALRRVNDRMGVMTAPAARYYFGRAGHMQHGWNASRHSGSEDLLLSALQRGRVQRGTFPTLSAIRCCAGRRAGIQANPRCTIMCPYYAAGHAAAAAVGVKYRYEGWIAQCMHAPPVGIARSCPVQTVCAFSRGQIRVAVCQAVHGQRNLPKPSSFGRSMAW